MESLSTELGPPHPLPAVRRRRRIPLREDLGDRVAQHLRHPGLLPYEQRPNDSFEQISTECGGLHSAPFLCDWTDLPSQHPGSVLVAALQLLLAQQYLASCGARCVDLQEGDVVVGADGLPQIWTPSILVPTEIPELITEDLEGVWRVCWRCGQNGKRELRETLVAVAAGTPLRTIYSDLTMRMEYRYPLSLHPAPTATRRPRRTRGSVLGNLLERTQTLLSRANRGVDTLRHRFDRRASTPASERKRHGPVIVAVLIVAATGVLAVVVFP
jgi:hypothetical protein